MSRQNDFELWMQGRRLSPRTVTERLSVLRQFQRQTGSDPELVDALTISRWFADHPDWSTGTVLAYHGALNSWFRWLVLQDLRVDNPMTKVGTPRAPERFPRPVTTDDLGRMLAAKQWPRTRTMILLGTFAGLRVHEIAKFRGADIAADRATFTVAGKGGTRRTLPLHPILADEADRMPHDWWFTALGDSSRPMQAKSVSAAIARVMRRTGVQGTPHSLRHYYATTLLENGADLRIVQSLMRHRNIQNTVVYTRVPDAASHAAVHGLTVPA